MSSKLKQRLCSYFRVFNRFCIFRIKKYFAKYFGEDFFIMLKIVNSLKIIWEFVPKLSHF